MSRPGFSRQNSTSLAKSSSVYRSVQLGSAARRRQARPLFRWRLARHRCWPSAGSGTWHHIAGTFESGEKTGAFYVNGKLVSNGKTAADQLAQIQSPLRLGSCCGLAGFAGILDELRIYDRALDDKEIERLFAYNPGAFPVSPVGLVVDHLG